MAASYVEKIAHLLYWIMLFAHDLYIAYCLGARLLSRRPPVFSCLAFLLPVFRTSGPFSVLLVLCDLTTGRILGQFSVVARRVPVCVSSPRLLAAALSCACGSQFSL